MASRTGALGELGSTPPRTGARLNLVLLLYYLTVMLVITLAPFRFVAPDDVRILLRGGWSDAIANVLLFVPLGFLYPLTRGSERVPSPARSFLLALLLSACIELGQLFEEGRFTSALDVLTNAAGAGLGTVLQRTVSRRIRLNANLIGRLSLELPLMGLLYLLIPLLWLGSWGAQEEPSRLLAVIPIGLFGARVLAVVHRYHFGPAGALGPRGIAMVAGGWMMLGSFPAGLRHPLVGAALVAGVAMLAGYEASRPETTPLRERRFESHAVGRAAPCMAVYFLLIALVPLAEGVRAWRVEWGLSGWANSLTIAEQLYRLQPMAALTVLGYMLAEARGRRELGYARIATRLMLECALVATVLELGAGLAPTGGASAARWILLVVAGLFGGSIYHLQRDHVRWLLAKGPAPTPAGGMQAHRTPAAMPG